MNIIETRNKSSIFQIPNIGYINNTYFVNKKKQKEITKAQELIWDGFGIILEPYNYKYKYRKALFPLGWKYLANIDDKYKRHGWFINKNGEKIVEIFVDDIDINKSIYVRIKFLQCIANI